MNTLIDNVKGPTGAKGATGATGLSGPRAVSADSGNAASLGSDGLAFVNPSVPLADASQNGLMRQTTGSTAMFLDGTNNYQATATALNPTILSLRSLSINVLHNPNFAIDQQNVNGFVSSNTSGRISDRWFANCSTLSWNSQNQATALWSPGYNSSVVSNNQVVLQTTSVKATLGSTDYATLEQTLEGPQYRPLAGGPTSISLYVYSPVANHKFAVYIRSQVSGYTYAHICTVPTANTWTYITVPNIPAAPGAIGSSQFPITPSARSAILGISLACGSGRVSPAPDTWRSGGYYGATGMDNFFANALNSNFYVSMVQWEAGPECTPFIVPTPSDSLLICQRYLAQGNASNTKCPTNNDWRAMGVYYPNQYCDVDIPYPVEMAEAVYPQTWDNATNYFGIYVDGLGQLITSGTNNPVCTSAGVGRIYLAGTQTLTALYPVLGQWQTDVSY